MPRSRRNQNQTCSQDDDDEEDFDVVDGSDHEDGSDREDDPPVPALQVRRRVAQIVNNPEPRPSNRAAQDVWHFFEKVPVSDSKTEATKECKVCKYVVDSCTTSFLLSHL